MEGLHGKGKSEWMDGPSGWIDCLELELETELETELATEAIVDV
jgi:hypothetical protein